MSSVRPARVVLLRRLVALATILVLVLPALGAAAVSANQVTVYFTPLDGTVTEAPCPIPLDGFGGGGGSDSGGSGGTCDSQSSGDGSDSGDSGGTGGSQSGGDGSDSGDSGGTGGSQSGGTGGTGSDGTDGGNGQTNTINWCGAEIPVLEQRRTYYCLDFHKIWLNADGSTTGPPDDEFVVRLTISLNNQVLGSFKCTQTECDRFVVFLTDTDFDPDRDFFSIEEDGLPQGWQLHSVYQGGATFLELRDPPCQGPGPACLNTRWRNYSDLYVTECLLVIANQQVASTGGTGEDNSGSGQGGSGQDGSGGSAGSSGGTGGTGGNGGSTGGASTAPDTSSVPASEAASPSTDTQSAGSSEALALQQPATEPSPASSAGSTMPPLPQVLPRTGQPRFVTSLAVAGLALTLLGAGLALPRRPARAR
jgi:hypothetical protein